jgi:hypothetical protein
MLLVSRLGETQWEDCTRPPSEPNHKSAQPFQDGQAYRGFGCNLEVDVAISSKNFVTYNLPQCSAPPHRQAINIIRSVFRAPFF